MSRSLQLDLFPDSLIVLNKYIDQNFPALQKVVAESKAAGRSIPQIVGDIAAAVGLELEGNYDMGEVCDRLIKELQARNVTNLSSIIH